jgi:hypothetical protein
MQDQTEVAGHSTELQGGPAAPTTANGSAQGDDLHELLRALQAMRMGDFSVRMAAESTGILGKIADTFNEIVSTNQHIAQQLEHVGQVVGKEGRTRQRLRFGLAMGSWGEICCGRPPRRREPSKLWPRATCWSPCASMSTAGR